MNDEHDSDLQRRIAAWREEEKARTPDYERVWQRAKWRAKQAASPPGNGRAWLRWTTALAAVVALAAAGFWWSARDTDGSWSAQLAALESELEMLPPAAEADSPAWEAPTDFLLAASPGDPLNPGYR